MAKGSCSFIKEGGQRCKGAPIKGGDLCAAHDPATQEARRAGAKRGGKLGGRGRPNVEVASIRDQLAALYQDTATGQVGEKRAAVLCQISGQMIRAASEERRLLYETGELVGAQEVFDLLKDMGDGVTKAGADRETRVRMWEAIEPIVDDFLSRRDTSRLKTSRSLPP